MMSEVQQHTILCGAQGTDAPVSSRALALPGVISKNL